MPSCSHKAWQQIHALHPWLSTAVDADTSSELLTDESCMFRILAPEAVCAAPVLEASSVPAGTGGNAAALQTQWSYESHDAFAANEL